jgi:hypothetical protein
VLLAPQKSAEQVRAFFADHGFEVGEAVAAGFALTGPRSAYLETFGTAPGAAGQDATLDELPLDRLPDEVAEGIEAVVLPAPPDFGPTSY